jgi:hypothetical protein
VGSAPLIIVGEGSVTIQAFVPRTMHVPDVTLQLVWVCFRSLTILAFSEKLLSAWGSMKCLWG